VAAVLALAGGLEAGAARQGDGRPAFESLKKLAGDWVGYLGAPDGPGVSIRYEVTSAGSVVMERLVVGGDTEMVSMYHMDGQDLVMTHYCAAGNQPRLRLNPAQSGPTELVFDFTGGGNMDPDVDGHMHSGRILLKDDTHFESVWIGYQGGKPSGSKRFILARKKP
jgi:hypothetical protein